MNCKHKIVKIFACGALIMKKTYFTVNFLAAIRKFVYMTGSAGVGPLKDENPHESVQGVWWYLDGLYCSDSRINRQEWS